MADSSLLEELMWADFGICEIDDEGLEQFLQRDAAPRLHELYSGGNDLLTDHSASSLANSMLIDRLTRLTLWKDSMTSKGKSLLHDKLTDNAKLLERPLNQSEIKTRFGSF